MQIPDGLGLYWRDSDCVQIGLHPDRRAIIDGLYPREVPLLNLLRNPCTAADVDVWAKSHQVDRDRARKIWETVSATGLARDATMPGRMARDEYAAAARAGAVDPEAARSTAVTIEGAGLIGSLLAIVLDLYGFGAVAVNDPHPVSESGARWLGLAAFGQPVEAAVRPRLRPGDPINRRIVVSVSSRVYPLHIARVCLADDIPYLPIVVAESDIQIGPFVTGSPCLECVESERTRQDSAWPLLSAQAGRLPMLEPDTASAFLTCGFAAAELLQFVTDEGYEPRLSSAIMHIPPPPSWPTLETVERAADCGCVFGS